MKLEYQQRYGFGEDYVGVNLTITSEASVPEPTTLALLSLGLFGLGFNKRKRL